MRELLVATKNPGKFKEIVEALDVTDFRLIFLGDLSVDDGDFIEDGETFEQNAEKKAKYYYEKFGGKFEFVLGEDSGIVVDALDGELGVKTRRWVSDSLRHDALASGAGEQEIKVSDKMWIEYFLNRMEGVKDAERGAEFVCYACVVGSASGRFFVQRFSGETKGVITHTLEAPITTGIPLSSCFKPDGFDQVYAALSVEQKNKISHRGKAMAPLKKFLKNLLFS